LTSPGVPDLYQGTELWDFSLVDPDNRRPVDFDQRRAWLAEVEAKGPPSEQLANWRDGRVKLALVRRALAVRQHAAALFAEGQYIPLEVEGENADRVIAFARHAGSAYAIVIATRLAQPLLSTDDDTPLVDAALPECGRAEGRRPAAPHARCSHGDAGGIAAVLMRHLVDATLTASGLTQNCNANA
jgi:(1->4)-alpha-D-glucan 1-alpha-D-glucosylmutase